MREGSKGLLKLFFLIVGIVMLSCVIFIAGNYIARGHADETFASTDIENIINNTAKKSAQLSMQLEVDAPYHYEFFSILDQPVAKKNLPEYQLEQNPAIALKYRRGIKVKDLKLYGNYAIQVASFTKASDAQDTVRTLQTQGYLAVIINDSANGKPIYRVRIDGGKQRESAEQLQAVIAKRTGMKGFVVAI